MQSPSMEAAQRLVWLRFTLIPGVGPRFQQRMLRAFGTPQEALEASPAAAARVLPEPGIAEAFCAGADAQAIERALAWLEQPRRQLVALGEEAYPRRWREIADPPTVFYSEGNVELLQREALGIVGSRNGTAQGLRDAHEFASALSEAGLCIASGMALGIDAAAHRGGLSAIGSSVAVVGTGLDIVYPRRNVELARELSERGCIVSEFPLGTPPRSANFPARNRLISGLSLGVLVVEAAPESGSLITARCAVRQGREVFALPGSIHSPLSRGCHDLIREGALLVDAADDILREIAPQRGVPPPAEGRVAAGMQGPAWLRQMGFAPATVEQLAQRCGEPVAAIAARLARLQLEGHVAALGGGWYQRVGQSSAARVIE